MRSVDFHRGGLGFAVNFRLFLASLVLFLGFVGGASAETPVSGCTTISSSGVYVLQNNILDDGSSTCIKITSSDVVFDGADYTIDGVGPRNTHGVYVYKSGITITNVTVRNVIVTEWGDGIYYSSVENGSIENNTVLNNRYGLYVDSSSSNSLTNNTASDNGYGIYLESSNDNTLTDNTVNSNNNVGILLNSSSNNTLTGNNASNNAVGIYLESSSNNTIYNNTANSNSNGIHLGSSSNNTLTNNAVNSNDDLGIRFFSSSNNTIYNNFFNNTWNTGFGFPSTNAWNTAKTPSTNIIDGPYLGGNFWATPDGTGFSETCIDKDTDGICDSSYTLASGNVDDLPLVESPTTVPPVETPKPEQEPVKAPEEENGGICGPTVVMLISMLTLLLKRKRTFS